MYRQANLLALRWRLSQVHWRPPATSDRTSVLPGDIAVNKLAPVRAAWATSRLYRHPIDSNCYLLRGVSRPTGFWVAVCLNQPAYAELLLRAAGAAILPRVTMRALKELPLLPPPPEAPALAERAWSLLDAILAGEESLSRLAEAAMDRTCPPETLHFWQHQIATETTNWWRRVPRASLSDSLVPGHALFDILRHHLRDELAWEPLDRFLAPEQPHRSRLPVALPGPPRLRCLRISDVATDFTAARIPEPQAVEWPGRVYRDPLRREEVLVSLLVSSPTVAFAGEIPRQEIHVTDHWERMRFRETPGAWAIILNSPLVRMQMRLLARGSARQFLNSGALSQLLVPNIPRDEREHWDRALRRYQHDRLEAEAAWDRLWNDALEVFHRVHRAAGAMLAAPADTRGVHTI